MKLFLFVGIFWLGTAVSNMSIYAQEGYFLPPQDVVDIVDADPTPAVSFTHDREWMAMLERSAMPDISDVARRMLRLAGMRIDPQGNAGFATSFFKGITLMRRSDGKEFKVPLPANAKISGTSWSHRNNALAFTLLTPEGTELHVVELGEPTKTRMLTDRLSTVVDGVQWLPSGQALLCQLVPRDRGPEPKETRVPRGPNIQESAGKTSPTRTYQDLLKNPYHEDLFEYYATNELAILGLDGSESTIGPKAIYWDSSISPDGEHLLLTTIHRPFSYLMTARSFPQKIEVRSIDGKPQYTVANVPMAENIPIEGVRQGRRRVDWMSARDATLVWCEALDGGDPDNPADFRDQLFTLAAPFEAEPTPLLKTEHRYAGTTYLENPSQLVVTDYDRDRRWIRTQLYDLSQPDSTPKTLMDRSIRDRYGDPGQMVETRDETGHSIVLQKGNSVFRVGAGASPQGNLPFLDRQNLVTMKTERLWRCEEGRYEVPVAILEADDGKVEFVTSSETKTTPPNYFIRSGDGNPVQITNFPDPTPQIRGIKKELVTYKRKDGVPLSATLYLPADYQEGERLPLLVWAYPREFNDVKTAAQISGSPNRFTRMNGISHLTFLTQGYAIMDSATMPVIGDPETMNDTFIEQIVDAAEAAIDYAVERGVADRNRVGVGGHSYGAFMTANLLAHCDLFKAGIARSGAYNRTLTPFGFQSERRSFWEAKEIYFSISPFMHADKIKEPMLLIHGEEDNNSGTFPIQSRRMFQAIKGNGGTVRLVMLPEESHGYRARQSVLHTQAEMIAWFDKYVKNAK